MRKNRFTETQFVSMPMPQKTVDSLLKIKMTIAIYPIMEGGVDRFGLKKIPGEFKRLVDATGCCNIEIKSVEGILSSKNHSIILADTVELKKAYDFENFDLLYWFSEIWYNRKKTKAVFEVGISRSRLNGYSTIRCFEKKEGGWTMVKSVPTTMW